MSIAFNYGKIGLEVGRFMVWYDFMGYEFWI